MEVYILQSGFDDDNVCGVFSSLLLAQAHVPDAQWSDYPTEYYVSIGYRISVHQFGTFAEKYTIRKIVVDEGE